MPNPAASPAVSSTVGLKNMVIAPLTVDTEETLTYGDLQLVAGAIEASITLPNLGSLERVDQFAFSGCESLALLGNLRKLTSFGYSPFVNSPFHNCPNLVLEVLPDSAAEQYAKDYNMQYTYITE